VLLALGLALGYAWRQRSSSDELALRTHAIQGTVTLTDASGFCVASPVEERCARLVHGEAMRAMPLRRMLVDRQSRRSLDDAGTVRSARRATAAERRSGSALARGL